MIFFSRKTDEESVRTPPILEFDLSLIFYGSSPFFFVDYGLHEKTTRLYQGIRLKRVRTFVRRCHIDTSTSQISAMIRTTQFQNRGTERRVLPHRKIENNPMLTWKLGEWWWLLTRMIVKWMGLLLVPNRLPSLYSSLLGLNFVRLNEQVIYQLSQKQKKIAHIHMDSWTSNDIFLLK